MKSCKVQTRSKMAHRQRYNENTKNYKALTMKFEEKLKEIVGNLMEERNALKQEVQMKNDQLTKIERTNIELFNTIEVLKEQLRSAKENCNTTKFFAKNVMAIAQNLSNADVDKDSERGFLYTMPTMLSPAINMATSPSSAKPNEDSSKPASATMEIVDHDDNESELVIVDEQENDVPVDQADTVEIGYQSTDPALAVVLDL